MTSAILPESPPGRRLARTPAPTGVERTFGQEEVIVSKTDLKGVITYANDVFIRVSGYAETELLGRPHNILRHPAMPRAVFALLWERIEAGVEIFAYVLNLAADGAHYWVLAHITPTRGAGGAVIGYHSNRRWVPPRVCQQVAELYAAVLAVERAAGGTKAALAAGQAALAAHLDGAGMSYDELVWSLVGDDAAR